MELSEDSDDARLGSVVKSVQTDKSWEVIGFVLAEVQLRSIAPYTRGSGPPLAPISIMPIHDKSGDILDLVQMDGQPVYIIGYDSKPALHLGIRPADILDYVSARTLENFELAQSERHNQKLYGKGKTRVGKQTIQESRAGGAKARGRPKRKRSVEEDSGDVSMSGEVVGQKNQIGEEVFTSAGQPSLSSVSKQHGLAGLISTESDDEDTLLFLKRPKSKLRAPQVDSESTSPGPAKALKQITTSARDTRSSSHQTRSASVASVQVSGDTKRQRTTRQPGKPHKDSIAGTSSIEAAMIYEDLEKNKNKQPKPKIIHEKYTQLGKSVSEIKPDIFYKSSSPARGKSIKPAPAKLIPIKQGAEPIDSDAEYEVDEILDDRVQNKKGKTVKYYLIKWVGNWPDSWEPEDNVGSEIIQLYETKRKEERIPRPLENASTSMAGYGVKDPGTNIQGNGTAVSVEVAQATGEATGKTSDETTNL